MGKGTDVKDYIVIGAGASGAMCAILLARNGKDVLVLEGGARACAKLAATGNGRCNASNVEISPSRYNVPEFVAPVLSRFTAESLRSCFADLLGVATREVDGRIYPYGNNSGCVVNALIARLSQCCELKVSVRAKRIVRVPFGYEVVASDADGGDVRFRCRKLVFACGSNATMGFDSLSLMSDLGYRVTERVPSIAPLPTRAFRGVSGVRAYARGTLFADGGEISTRYGEVLFRDDAVSGMLAMELSSAYARALRNGARAFSLVLDFVPDIPDDKIDGILCSSACDARGALIGFVPRALGEKLAAAAGIESGARAADRLDDLRRCLRPEITIEGVPSFKQAQVVCGGLDTSQFSPKTMMSLRDEGLFAIGEALDVDGDCGGFNLHWAWASAAVCASEEASC